MNSKAIADYIIKNENNLSLSILIQYIKKHRLEFLLNDVLKRLSYHIRHESDLNRIMLISPHSISDDNRHSLESKYTLTIDKQYNRIDKNLIAGYKIYTRDRIIDASLDTLLKNFTK